jgi:hypothetical protein
VTAGYSCKGGAPPDPFSMTVVQQTVVTGITSQQGVPHTSHAAPYEGEAPTPTAVAVLISYRPHKVHRLMSL